MPELHFRIRWPDGTEETCYSPSTVIGAHLTAGASYPLPVFLDHVRAGLNAASDRVFARYGFACSSALDQLARIEATARRFADRPGEVTCLSLT